VLLPAGRLLASKEIFVKGMVSPRRRHNLSMRSLNWPAARLASAALCAALCVAVAACSGGPASPSASVSHTASPSASASPSQAASGPAAMAAVKAMWQTFFNGAVPIPRRLELLQNGQQFATFVRSQEKTSLGSLVLSASAKVSSVTLQPSGQASVTYTVLLGGKPLAKNLVGAAVYVGGSWKVAVTTFCGMLHVAYGKASHLPAACGS
jgi:hypothetical protein